MIILVITFFEVVMANMEAMLHIVEDGELSNIWILLVIPLGVLLIAVGIGAFKKLVHE